MHSNDNFFPLAGMIDIGAIISFIVALLYTAGWSYAYYYFQCFHLGLIALGIEREYFLLYGFWVCKACFFPVLICLLCAVGLQLLFRYQLQQAASSGETRRIFRLRAIALIGMPVSILLLFIIFYNLGTWTGQAAFVREQRGDFPSYPRARVWLKDKKDKRAKVLAKGCHRLLLRGKDQIYLFRPDGISQQLATEIVPISEAAGMRVRPLYQTDPDKCQ